MNGPVQFHYRFKGDTNAQTLLFLHGFLGDLREWDPIVDALLPDYRCLTVDLPGHGKTSASAFDDQDDLSSVARAVLTFLDTLDVTRCSLIGYSMGGRLALQMAVLDPARFAGLVLESASPGLRDEAERKRRAEDDSKLAARLAASDFATFLKDWYTQSMFGDMRRDQKRFSALICQRLDNNPEHLARALRLMSVGRQSSLWDAWAANRISTLLLAGKLDAKYVGIEAQMAQVCPTVKTRVFDRCGHNVHYAHADEYAQAVRAFLQRS